MRMRTPSTALIWLITAPPRPITTPTRSSGTAMTRLVVPTPAAAAAAAWGRKAPAPPPGGGAAPPQASAGAAAGGPKPRLTSVSSG
ncbi:hypothetical protein F751_0916 [Auxenochlorella protothecoides]|uniref:Uncharacterized protein n=1 Tax=Auxenochlorella protothecoides TaxID=3075 RepID=A0A087SD98_AUXPR|nr:hypothetical protein F751_0916 [Auxenochlorella protothecoides]KFM23702.1 hypothetical protein F751_0916 [Auxenochlorella protothecoides]